MRYWWWFLQKSDIPKAEGLANINTVLEDHFDPSEENISDSPDIPWTNFSNNNGNPDDYALLVPVLWSAAGQRRILFKISQTRTEYATIVEVLYKYTC